MNSLIVRQVGLPPPLTAVSAPSGDKPLHVVEIVGTQPPDEGPHDGANGANGANDTDRLGATRLVERLVERLSASGGIRFTVVCPSEGPFAERIRSLGAETVIVAMPEDPPWHAIQVLVGLIRNRQAEVLHAHLPNAHRLAGLAGGLTRTPVLSTVQGQQLDMPDLEVHRLVASQLSVVTEASYFHALGLGIAPERISCEPIEADTPEDLAAGSLEALGQRLRAMAGVNLSRGTAQARALAQPLTASGGALGR